MSTFATNHPFAIVKRDWVDADEEEGAKRYFAFLIPVFGVAFGGQADDASLKAISAAAGGETRRGDSAEIREIFKLFRELL